MYSFLMGKIASEAVINKVTHAYIHIRRLDELRSECEATAGGNTDMDTFIFDASQILNYITHIYVMCTSHGHSSSSVNSGKDSRPRSIEEATNMLQEFNSLVRSFARPALRAQLTAIMYRIRAFGYGREKKWASALKCLLKIKPFSETPNSVTGNNGKSFGIDELDVDTLLLMCEVYDALDRRDEALECAKCSVNVAQTLISDPRRPSGTAMAPHRVKRALGPTLPPRAALAIAYHSLARQLDACSMSHLSVGWHERAFKACLSSWVRDPQQQQSAAGRSRTISEDNFSLGGGDVVTSETTDGVQIVVDQELADKLKDFWELSTSFPTLKQISAQDQVSCEQLEPPSPLISQTVVKLASNSSHNTNNGNSETIVMQRTLSDADCADEKLDRFDMNGNVLTIASALHSYSHKELLQLIQQPPLTQVQTVLEAQNPPALDDVAPSPASAELVAAAVTRAGAGSSSKGKNKGPSIYFSENDSSELDQLRLSKKPLTQPAPQQPPEQQRRLGPGQADDWKANASNYALTHLPGQDKPIIAITSQKTDNDVLGGASSSRNQASSRRPSSSTQASSGKSLSAGLPDHTALIGTDLSRPSSPDKVMITRAQSNNSALSPTHTFIARTGSVNTSEGTAPLNAPAAAMLKRTRSDSVLSSRPSIPISTSHDVSNNIADNMITATLLSSPRTNNSSPITARSNNINTSNSNANSIGVSPSGQLTQRSARSSKLDHLRIFTDLTGNNGRQSTSPTMASLKLPLHTLVNQNDMPASNRANNPAMGAASNVSANPNSNAVGCVSAAGTPTGRRRYTSWTSARLSSVIAEDKLADSFLFTGPYVNLTTHTPVRQPAPIIPPKPTVEQEYQQLKQQQRQQRRRQMTETGTEAGPGTGTGIGMGMGMSAATVAGEPVHSATINATLHTIPQPHMQYEQPNKTSTSATAAIMTSDYKDDVDPTSILTDKERARLRSPLKKHQNKQRQLFMRSTLQFIDRVNAYRQSAHTETELLPQRQAEIQNQTPTSIPISTQIQSANTNKAHMKAQKEAKQRAKQLLRTVYGGGLLDKGPAAQTQAPTATAHSSAGQQHTTSASSRFPGQTVVQPGNNVHSHNQTQKTKQDLSEQWDRHGLGPNLHKVQDSHLVQYLDRVAADAYHQQQQSQQQHQSPQHLPRHIPLYQLSGNHRHVHASIDPVTQQTRYDFNHFEETNYLNGTLDTTLQANDSLRRDVFGLFSLPEPEPRHEQASQEEQYMPSKLQSVDILNLDHELPSYGYHNSGWQGADTAFGVDTGISPRDMPIDNAGNDIIDEYNNNGYNSYNNDQVAVVPITASRTRPRTILLPRTGDLNLAQDLEHDRDVQKQKTTKPRPSSAGALRAHRSPAMTTTASAAAKRTRPLSGSNIRAHNNRRKASTDYMDANNNRNNSKQNDDVNMGIDDERARFMDGRSSSANNLIATATAGQGPRWTNQSEPTNGCGTEYRNNVEDKDNDNDNDVDRTASRFLSAFRCERGVVLADYNHHYSANEGVLVQALSGEVIAVPFTKMKKIRCLKPVPALSTRPTIASSLHSYPLAMPQSSSSFSSSLSPSTLSARHQRSAHTEAMHHQMALVRRQALLALQQRRYESCVRIQAWVRGYLTRWGQAPRYHLSSSLRYSVGLHLRNVRGLRDRERNLRRRERELEERMRALQEREEADRLAAGIHITGRYMAHDRGRGDACEGDGEGDAKPADNDMDMDALMEQLHAVNADNEDDVVAAEADLLHLDVNDENYGTLVESDAIVKEDRATEGRNSDDGDDDTVVGDGTAQDDPDIAPDTDIDIDAQSTAGADEAATWDTLMASLNDARLEAETAPSAMMALAFPREVEELAEVLIRDHLSRHSSFHTANAAQPAHDGYG